MILEAWILDVGERGETVVNRLGGVIGADDNGNRRPPRLVVSGERGEEKTSATGCRRGLRPTLASRRGRTTSCR
jgi:hypothetical protein